MGLGVKPSAKTGCSEERTGTYEKEPDRMSRREKCNHWN